MASQQLENLEQIVEAVLFVYGEPLNAEKIAKTIKVKTEAVRTALVGLKNNLAGRGIKLLEQDGYWQLAADKSASPAIENLVKNEIREELTPASLEVLAITAYHGPVTKSQVETIRGVNSAYSLRTLVLRGLVERTIASGKTNAYKISLAALRKLGLEKIEELPLFDQLKQKTVKTENILNAQS